MRWDAQGVATSADVVVADFEFAGWTLRPWSCRGKIGRRDKGPRRVSRLPMRTTCNFLYTATPTTSWTNTRTDIRRDIQHETSIADRPGSC